MGVRGRALTSDLMPMSTHHFSLADAL